MVRIYQDLTLQLFGNQNNMTAHIILTSKNFSLLLFNHNANNSGVELLIRISLKKRNKGTEEMRYKYW